MEGAAHCTHTHPERERERDRQRCTRAVCYPAVSRCDDVLRLAVPARLPFGFPLQAFPANAACFMGYEWTMKVLNEVMDEEAPI